MELNQNDSEKQEGEIILEDESKKSTKGRLIFLFVVGFLLGISLKAQAIKSVTMGFDDYKAKSVSEDFAVEKQPMQDAEQAPTDQVPSQDDDGTQPPSDEEPLPVEITQ